MQEDPIINVKPFIPLPVNSKSAYSALFIPDITDCGFKGILTQQPSILTKYGYAGLNPVKSIDPSGALSKCDKKLLQAFLVCFSLGSVIPDVGFGIALMSCAGTPFPNKSTINKILCRSSIVSL